MVTLSKVIAFANGKSVNYNENSNCELSGAAPLGEAKSGDLSLCRSSLDNATEILSSTKASLVFVDHDVELPDDSQCVLVKCDNARLEFMRVINEFFISDHIPHIDATAQIHSTAEIGKNVFIGAHCVIGAECIICDGTIIHANVIMYAKTQIGTDCVVHANCVIGADGFGFEIDENENIHKFPHIGGVTIGDRVEIMALTHIARGTLGQTIIKNDTKIDSLCHIGHNVQIGEKCRIVSNTMIGGSTIIGDRTYIAPSAALLNKLKIGNDAFIGIGSVVLKNVEDKQRVFGSPARPIL